MNERQERKPTLKLFWTRCVMTQEIKSMQVHSRSEGYTFVYICIDLWHVSADYLVHVHCTSICTKDKLSHRDKKNYEEFCTMITLYVYFTKKKPTFI